MSIFYDKIINQDNSIFFSFDENNIKTNNNNILTTYGDDITISSNHIWKLLKTNEFTYDNINPLFFTKKTDSVGELTVFVTNFNSPTKIQTLKLLGQYNITNWIVPLLNVTSYLIINMKYDNKEYIVFDSRWNQKSRNWTLKNLNFTHDNIDQSFFINGEPVNFSQYDWGRFVTSMNYLPGITWKGLSINEYISLKTGKSKIFMEEDKKMKTLLEELLQIRKTDTGIIESFSKDTFIKPGYSPCGQKLATVPFPESQKSIYQTSGFIKVRTGRSVYGNSNKEIKKAIGKYGNRMKPIYKITQNTVYNINITNNGYYNCQSIQWDTNNKTLKRTGILNNWIEVSSAEIASDIEKRVWLSVLVQAQGGSGGKAATFSEGGNGGGGASTLLAWNSDKTDVYIYEDWSGDIIICFSNPIQYEGYISPQYPYIKLQKGKSGAEGNPGINVSDGADGGSASYYMYNIYGQAPSPIKSHCWVEANAVHGRHLWCLKEKEIYVMAICRGTKGAQDFFAYPYTEPMTDLSTSELKAKNSLWLDVHSETGGNCGGASWFGSGGSRSPSKDHYGAGAGGQGWEPSWNQKIIYNEAPGVFIIMY